MVCSIHLFLENGGTSTKKGRYPEQVYFIITSIDWKTNIISSVNSKQSFNHLNLLLNVIFKNIHFPLSFSPVDGFHLITLSYAKSTSGIESKKVL